MMYINISLNYSAIGNNAKALIYNDSAFAYRSKMSVYNKSVIPKQRSELFYLLGNSDSAYHYLKIAQNEEIEKMKKQESENNKRLEEYYQDQQKEAIIKTKNLQMLLGGSLLLVIVGGSVLLYRNNQKIKHQNKIINSQLIDLSKILEQKQVLLSELQHRVKNNLQHVISILEIQKESVNFNNIDELIRGNQNRIHSMALLHKKLNITDNANEIDLKKYVTELTELVKDSYDNPRKKIELNILCEIEKMAIETALPLGLILVELLSNSLKHAFKKQRIGIINIKIKHDKKTHKNSIYYADNGSGFDYYQTSEKGLGMEITKGLIDQLNGTVKTGNTQGFELTIIFP